MSFKFAQSLRLSKQLSTYSKIIFYPKLFSVATVRQNIVEVKKIVIDERSPLIVNITHCLQGLRFINTIITKLEKMQSTTFSYDNKVHSALLEDFWRYMRPEVLRKDPSQWGEVGFQGKDPATDFRGMGILGLVQLQYLSHVHGDLARDILLEAEHPRRYFPFAATGINITAFVMELAKNRHLHKKLFKLLDENCLSVAFSAAEGPAGSTELVDLGCSWLHEIYCDVYKRFKEVWIEKDPANVLAFQKIFGEVKEEFKRAYPSF